ncbi:MAG TPA: dipeptidase PepE [Pyrinomonadaceae bacterium]|jgi:dipeptidase E|nr:dipeptidase PepE [Pyrinomonadaceae bacterium]
MANRRLLLLSNSTNYGERYLEYSASAIRDFLGGEALTVLFVPFAGVRFSFAEYARIVGERFAELGYKLESVHEASDARLAVRRARAIAIGGGNTFHLLRALYETGLIEAIRSRVSDGVPFIGWSAGSNVACPTIRTTNDMPIVEPPSLRALDLVPFQINPHYTDEHPPGHAGETREQRLAEFIEVNEGVYVVGLREGSMLRIEGSSIRLLGEKSARVFIKGEQATEYTPQDSLQFLLKREPVIESP